MNMTHIMRFMIIILISSTFIACRSFTIGNISDRIDSIYVEKLIPVILPEDSAKIRALLECDKNGKIVLKWLDIANSKNVKLLFQIDSLGNLFTEMKVPPDTIRIPSKEKLVYRDKQVEKIITVEKKLNWWEQFFLYSGIILWCSIIIYLLIKYSKKTVKL